MPLDAKRMGTPPGNYLLDSMLLHRDKAQDAAFVLAKYSGLFALTLTMLAIVAPAAWSSWGAPWQWQTLFVSAGCLAVVAMLWCAGKVYTTAKRIRHHLNEALNCEIGYKGEMLVAHHLNQLGRRGYFVFHDVRPPKRTANIDHLLVGPNGVFVVETKSRSIEKGIFPSVVYDGKAIKFPNGYRDEASVSQARTNREVGKVHAG